MNRIMTGGEIPIELMRAFGMPEHVVAFSINARYGEMVKVTCEYHPPLDPDANGELFEVLAEYELVSKAQWQNEQYPQEGMWCWVTDGATVWLACRDSLAANGWTNSDTWEDFNRSIVHWMPLEQPEAPSNE